MVGRKKPEAAFLLVSTDPAHSLVDSLADSRPPPNLEIMELNAQKSLAAFKQQNEWKLREMAARGTFFDAEDIEAILNLSLPGLDELTAFLEITRLVEAHRYDCIFIDTAPTGHTLRLLGMPELARGWLGALDAMLAKHRYMKKVFGRTSSRDELDDWLERMSASIERTEELLQDPSRCRFVPVMLAEAMSICETETLLDELRRLKTPVTDIVVNKIYPLNGCPACNDGYTRQKNEIKAFIRTPQMSRYGFWQVPLYPAEIRGRHLNDFWEKAGLLDTADTADENPRSPQAILVESPAESSCTDATFLVFAGKGGVGKTTLACATALRLAQDFPEKEVLLFSTDPAHSLSACLDVPVGPDPTRLIRGLTALEIDAQAQFQEFREQYTLELQEFLESLLGNMDLAFDRRAMEKILDLSPPGLDEVMALTYVMNLLAHGSYDILVLDSAPTGHLIRLLELPELVDQWLKVFFGLFLKYKNIFRLPNLSRRLVEVSKNLKTLKSLLTDPARAALYIVGIPTEMAFDETQDLMAACVRMKIPVPALFLNLATRSAACPLCSALHRREALVMHKFQRTFPTLRHTVVYRDGELRGLEQLGSLGRELYQQQQHTAVDYAQSN
jgi:arsenite-transporting ATPase